ncbi:hypothetical protein DAEQUDRAFT_664274 [Daedalea quercina L-15889]|uniref:Uncharacterized protein n=1 Tax=Daedalea quercina L-15889 TaxID=1314783 RepID=A0A165SRH2_9APHY|nr:hypothetical protein DAEQUDRAFT_664274 [Daedalea quercina L-15889]
MVIIEINRSFENHKVILGLHRWSKVLREPTSEEKKMDSRVFHCTYQTMREVEKYGWKRIDLQDEWFVSKGRIAKWHRINE